MTYDQWFRSQQGIPYAGQYLFAEAAWTHQLTRIIDLHTANAALKEQLESLVSRYNKGMRENLAEALKGQETIAQQADVIKQLRIEADFNFEQYQDAGRLMFELKEVTEQQAEQIASLVATNSLLDAEWKKTTADKFAEMAEAIRLKDAALEHVVASVPEGYQLVPIEPTEAMMWALYRHWVGRLTHLDYECYKAMLAAARSE